MDENEPTRWHSITADSQRQELRPGDFVQVVTDDGTRVKYEVKYAPWQLGGGTWVIGLKGMAGGYLLSRVAAFRLPTVTPETSTAGELLRRQRLAGPAPQVVLDALQAAVEAYPSE